MSFLENIDRAKLQKIMIIVIAALTLVALSLLLVIIISSIAPETPKTNNIEFDMIAVTDKDVKAGSLVLADGEHQYIVDKELLDLVDCQEFRNQKLESAGIDKDNRENYTYFPYKGMKLNKTAMDNLHAMLTDAKEAVQQLSVTIDAAFDRIVYGGVNTPEYNTGLLVFLSDNKSDSGSYVALSDEYANWLNDNAHKYGFINSFDDAYRYVGVEHATYIKNNSISLSDYITLLKTEHNSEKEMLEIKVGDQTYGVYFVECETSSEIKVPKEQYGSYTISGTNNGGVVVTVKLANTK